MNTIKINTKSKPKINSKRNVFFLLISTCSFAAYADNINNSEHLAAATDSDGLLETVTVTARRRDEDNKNVPFSVGRLTLNAIDSASANDEIGELSRDVGNLTLTEPGGTYSNTFLMRGVG